MREGREAKNQNQTSSVKKRMPSSGSSTHKKGITVTGTRRKGKVPPYNEIGQTKLQNYLELNNPAQKGSLTTNGRGKLLAESAANISVLGNETKKTEAQILNGTEATQLNIIRK